MNLDNVLKRGFISTALAGVLFSWVAADDTAVVSVGVGAASVGGEFLQHPLGAEKDPYRKRGKRGLGSRAFNVDSNLTGGAGDSVSSNERLSNLWKSAKLDSKSNEGSGLKKSVGLGVVAVSDKKETSVVSLVRNSDGLLLPKKREAIDRRSELAKIVGSFPIMKTLGVVPLLVQKHDDVLGGIYQIRTKEGDLFVSKKDHGIFFSGVNHVKRFVGLETGVESLYIKQDLSFVKDKALVSFGDGKEDLVFVLNPECATCRALYVKCMMYPNVMEQYKVHVVLRAKETDYGYSQNGVINIKNIIAIQDKNMRAKALGELMFGENLVKYRKLNKKGVSIYSIDKVFKEQMDISVLLGAHKSPMIFKMDGKPVDHNYFMGKIEKDYYAKSKKEK
ncbi:MAG: hypothetical protein U9O83_02865 [Campylobacterota bacterium]|nr:hypothetical protein [Campylobacterota bacterium]